ncbi:hypothetical protein BpHYR1_021194 [Brachionus plicatilis]|uniref:Uncharacterized protein n=1 Tax=Brachionus plicatilis TaxID=10195 RepID=A0A3M7TCZ9_BRAPC|nr:hypothetical protein BpHYR1_021194 [Brachionus plicatilis]
MLLIKLFDRVNRVPREYLLGTGMLDCSTVIGIQAIQTTVNLDVNIGNYYFLPNFPNILLYNMEYLFFNCSTEKTL